MQPHLDLVTGRRRPHLHTLQQHTHHLPFVRHRCLRGLPQRRQIVGQPLNDSGQMVNAKYDNNGNELGAIASPPAPYWTDPASYKILRQPMKTSAEPLQLPEGSAIDLRAALDDGYVKAMVAVRCSRLRLGRIRHAQPRQPRRRRKTPCQAPVPKHCFRPTGRRP